MVTRTRVLYDGQCSLCRRSIQALQARDTRGRLEATDLHQADLPRLHPALDRTACLQEMHVITPDGVVLRGFDAFRHIALQLPSTAWWAGFLYIPPVPQAGRVVYRWIAARRCQCKTGTCRIHAGHRTADIGHQ